MLSDQKEMLTASGVRIPYCPTHPSMGTLNSPFLSLDWAACSPLKVALQVRCP